MYLQVGDYTLTLKAAHRNKHFRVKVDASTYCIGQQTFDSLDHLVEHYKKHPIYRHGKDKLYLYKAFSPPQEIETEDSACSEDAIA